MWSQLQVLIVNWLACHLVSGATKSTNACQIVGSYRGIPASCKLEVRFGFFSLNFPLNFPSNHQPNPRTWRRCHGMLGSTRIRSRSVAERSSRSALWSAPLTVFPMTLKIIMKSSTKTSKWPLGRWSEVSMRWTRRLLSSRTFRRSEFLHCKLFGIFGWTSFNFLVVSGTMASFPGTLTSAPSSSKDSLSTSRTSCLLAWILYKIHLRDIQARKPWLGSQAGVSLRSEMFWIFLTNFLLLSSFRVISPAPLSDPSRFQSWISIPAWRKHRQISKIKSSRTRSQDNFSFDFIFHFFLFLKICAGYVDSNPSYTKVVCQGDSGGGLLIPQARGSKKHYYLQGVVSNSQRTLDCDTKFYTLFTNVQYYKFLINAANKKVLKDSTQQ